MAANTKELLAEVVDYLAKNNIDVWIFGGWAEELNKTIKPRIHKDFDLFYFSQDFEAIDNFIKEEQLLEISTKHFYHKRAFLYKDIMTELFLIEKDEKGFYTNFWTQKKYYWPDDLKKTAQGMKVIAPMALEQYRANYLVIENLRNRLR